jgi:hypothetical protein
VTRLHGHEVALSSAVPPPRLRFVTS